MRRKKYIKPDMEIYEFDAEDVIVTSGDGEETGGDEGDKEYSEDL